MMKRSLALLFSFSCAASLVSSTALAAGGPQAGKSVKAGVIADVTGSAGAYGTAQKNAYDLAADDLKAGKLDAGGAALSFDVQDPASDPAQVVALAQKFTTDGAALMIGPTLSSEAFKADPLAVRAGLTILATSNTANGITAQGPCVFRDSLSEDQVVPVTVFRTSAKWHPKTAAIIYGDDNQFTKTDYEIFKRGLGRENIQIVDTETYRTGDIDFKAQLTNIAGKKPDVLVLGSLVQEAVKIVQQAKAAGITAHMMGGNGLNSPKFIELGGPAAENVVVGAAYFSGNRFSGNPEFVARYKAKYGSLPDQFAAQAYAAAQIVSYAAKHGALTSPQFCTAFNTLKNVPTVLGPFAFDPNRDAIAPSAILQVRGGKFQYFQQ
jgi:branched-chain amino acid transport system substrate-binding protein